MENTGKLAEALAKAQGEFPKIKRNQTANAGQYSYDYADLADIIAAVTPALSRHGLSVVQETDFEGTTFFIKTVLLHSSGECRVGRIPVTLHDKPQALGSLLTYYRRYTLCAMLNVQAENEDDDGLAAMPPNYRPKNEPQAQVNKVATQTRVTPQQAPQPAQNTTGGAVKKEYKPDIGKKVTDAQLKLLYTKQQPMGWSTDNLRDLMKMRGMPEMMRDLNQVQFQELLETVQAKRFSDIVGAPPKSLMDELPPLDDSQIPF